MIQRKGGKLPAAASTDVATDCDRAQADIERTWPSGVSRRRRTREGSSKSASYTDGS
jgi:hypothetical protein